LKVADFGFDADGIPFLSNVESYIPGDSVLYENHGFSPDGKWLIFMSNFSISTAPLGGNKIYRMELATGKAEMLAGVGYNEHACFSPEGNYIIWGTSMENKNKGMDYWVMKADGSEKQRLTYFNQKGYMESSKQRMLAVDMSWRANGRSILCYVQDNLLKDEGRIYRIDFKKPVKE
jgi:Tol biopolymer transport system component